MNALSQDKVKFIISIAREVGESSLAIIGEELAESNEPQQYSEISLAAEADGSAKEEQAGNPAYQELVSSINGMNEEARSELVALMWLGRGTYTKAEWSSAVDDARDASNDHTAEYLMGAPLLPDYLEEGLSMMVEG